jgi:hypothetical protein
LTAPKGTENLVDLTQLTTILQTQAQAKSTLVLDSSVFPASVLDDIRTAFELAAGTNLTITGVKPTDIPTPSASGVLTISAGAAAALNQSGVKIGLTFTAPGGTLQALIVATMPTSWKFSDSFTDLDIFPFQTLTTPNARFVFATTAQPTYAWPDDSSYSIPLQQGLNFLSDVSFDVFAPVKSLLKDLIKTPSHKFYGPFAPTAEQQLPIATLRAPVATGSFQVGVPPISLTLTAPAVVVRINPVDGNSPLQEVELLVEAKFQNTLQVEVGIPMSGSTLTISTSPLSNQASLNSLIEMLPGGKDFTSYIPKEMSTIFAGVGLDNFSMVVDPTPEVTYLSLSLSTVEPWPVISDVLVLEGLILRIQTIDPGPSGWMQVSIAAKSKFLPHIFKGEFDFTVDLEKHTSSEVSAVSGAYYGLVSLGDIVGGLSSSQNSVPSALRDIQFSDFGVSAPRSSPDSGVAYILHGSAEAAFPIFDRDLTAHLNLSVTRTSRSYDILLSGAFVIGQEDFNFDLDLGTQQPKLTAKWVPYENPLGFNDVARAFGWSSMPPLPENLDLALTDVAFTYDFTAGTVALSAHSTRYGQILFASLLTPHDSPEPGKRVYLFSLDVPLNLELSGLPLVGDKLPSEAQLGIKDLQIIVASSDLATSDVTALNTLITSTLKDAPLIPASLAEGLTFASELQMGGGSQPVVVQLSGTAPTSSSTNQPASTPARTSAAIAPQAGAPAASTGQTSAPDYHADARWFNLQKTFGPVYFDKIGVQYQDAVLWFLLDASLSAAGLTISLDGLSVGSPLTNFSPHFNLHGLGIDYQGGPVEIGAAFLRIETKGQPDQYDGAAVIKTPEATLSALGSYAELDGHPSLFIYALLNYPLGGPVFFFVTGLAAGFGYNRKLIPPSIDKVADFPLVQQALGAVAAPTHLLDALQALTDYVPPAIGEIFLAVGVRFNSFKLIDSFALITVQFGGPVVASVMGVSTAIVPTPDPQAANSVTPLAEAQIAWKATFDPADGFLGVDARLTPNSYILSRDCRLTGGYAFYSWFSGKHAGDFVQTLGGYHPRFAAPAHYPAVPRLGFLWQVSSELTIKGDAYYALTGSALMAGGSLEVLFDEGDLKAWLKMGADFLISWKPYHYDIGLYVDVGASYTFDINLLFGHIRKTISVDVGADLHLWGPDFSGTAEVDISVISFTISFGAGASQTPNPIDWTTFQASFLPAHEKVCSLSVKDGLVRTMKEGDDERPERWIINPKHFSLLVNTAIPLKSGLSEKKELITADANTKFGIGSMAVPPDNLHSTISISITRDGSPADEEFSYAPILKKVPAGLWGESLTPDLNGNTFIENVPAGVEITPRKSHEPGETARIDLSRFKYAPSYFPKDAGHPRTTGFAYAWEPGGSFVSSNADGRESVSKTVENNSQRKLLLEAMNVAVAANISGKVAADFLSAPKVGTFSG